MSQEEIEYYKTEIERVCGTSQASVSGALSATNGERDAHSEVPLIVGYHGTVLELFDSEDVASVVNLVEMGIAGSEPSELTNLFWAAAGELILEAPWQGGTEILGYRVFWMGDDWFEVNLGRPDARRFRSRKLRCKLAELAETQSVRTWILSNPELNPG